MKKDIDKYNSLVGSVYIKDPEFFMYSPAFCRVEAQTFLFDFWDDGTYPKINFLKNYLIFLCRIIRDLLLSKIFKVKKELNGKDIFVFSYFDFRNIDNGKLREEFFRDILEYNNKVACFYKFITPGFLRRGYKYSKLLKSAEKSFNAYSELSFVDVKMMIRALLQTYEHYKKFKNSTISTGDKKLDNLLIMFHQNEIASGIVYQGYLQKEIYQKLLKEKPKKILFVWENQPWHRILEYVKKDISPKTKSIGFQHTGFSKRLLQHYPSNEEKNLSTCPDVIICNGVINKEELEVNSNLNSDIIVGSALRQSHLKKVFLSKLKDIIPRNFNSVAFAFSWNQSDYNEIIDQLMELPSNFTIYLKFHPNYPCWLNKSDLPERFINSTETWEQIGKKCPLVVVSDNSLMFEGFFLGMHTAIYYGADARKFGKRDFSSPIAQLTAKDLKDLNSEKLINYINESSKEVVKSEYLFKYFAFNSKEQQMKQFLE